MPFAAPGDRLRVRLTEEQRRFARGTIEALIEPGAARAEPPCPAFGRCGGCAWQHVGYAEQLAAKREILRQALRRIGGLVPPARIDVTPSPSPYAYRSRARVLVEGSQVGFRERGSPRVCPVQACPVLTPELEARLAELARHPPAAGEWEIAAGDAGPARALPLLSPGRTASPEPSLEFGVEGARLRVSGGVFVQANAALLRPLGRAVCRAAAAGGRPAGEDLLELYAGAGFLTLPLARLFRRVTAVESNPAAVRDLVENARRAGLENLEVRQQRAETALASLAGPPPDVVVLDPPRTGLPRAAAGRLAALGARSIAYLSCDPATLARDLALLCRSAYRLAQLEAFDLFPQTPHVEALATLERLPDAARV